MSTAEQSEAHFTSFPARDGTTLCARIEGAGEPVLMLHEFASARHCFDGFRERLDQHRRIELHARGYSPDTSADELGACSQLAAVADGIDALDALGIDRAHLIGVSMGAATALLMALRHPERVASAVLIGAGGGGLPHLRDAWAANAERMAERFETEDTCEVARAFLDGISRQSLKLCRPALFGQLVSDLAARPGRTSAMVLRNVLLKRPLLSELRDELDESRVPMLIVSGTADAHALAAGAYLASPCRWDIVIEGAGHTPQIEFPEALAGTVQSFLATARG